MRVTVLTLRQAGVFKLAAEVKESASRPFIGDLSVDQIRDPKVGRAVLRARLLNISEGTQKDVLPELSDAQLLWAGDGKMRLSGLERCNNADVAQTWSIKVEKC